MMICGEMASNGEEIEGMIRKKRKHTRDLDVLHAFTGYHVDGGGSESSQRSCHMIQALISLLGLGRFHNAWLGI